MNKPTRSYVQICKKALDASRNLLHASGVALAEDEKDLEKRADHEKAARYFVEAEERYQRARTAFHA